ncbi:hypothetical protein SLEP1_g778 [Rubroshorea leprosula]|uniref:Uncharacterized protein n=1 Tax=Rubroshorea leprosula TaxID=152421 RepID=A0AAV5HMJ8_9ROSI|nr:hypothetical protein SLEP1_g778 [Rubroshorea leprosula]
MPDPLLAACAASNGSLDDICFFTQNEDVDCDEDNNSEVFL